MDSSHWIGSIAFEFRSSEQEALDPVRREVRENHEAMVVRPLLEALDRAESPGRITRHRRIELDLGVIRPGDLGAALARRIGEAIPRALQLSPFAPSPDRLADEAEMLLSFLETGTLGWPSPGKALDAISQALAVRDDAFMARFAAELGLLFARTPSAALRFVRQCPAKLVLAICAILGKFAARPLRALEAFESHIGEGKAPRLASLLVLLARQQSLPDSERQWLIDLVSGVSGDGVTLTTEPGQIPPHGTDSFGSHPDELATVRYRSVKREAERTAENAEEAARLPLEAAGLVILHPFLVPLFAACELLGEEGKFRGECERARAVLLLHFAATRQTDPPEPELALAKLLCGLEPSEPVPRLFEPTAIERSECDAMLASAIAHWNALGNSSPDALREAFLKRPGHLRKKGQEWCLAVEQRGVDVLLDRLPWGISLFKTRFMARPLRVEWR